MFIRIRDGRDNGEVKEFSFDDAQAMIRNGQAEPVNFAEADPLAKRIEVEEVQKQPMLASPRIAEAPAVMSRHAQKVKKRF